VPSATEKANGRPALLESKGRSVCQVSHDHGSAEMRFSRETVEELLAEVMQHAARKH